MTAIPHTPSPYPLILLSDGTDMKNGKNGVTLASGATYFILIGGDAALVTSFHLQWDNAIILTSVAVEDSNNPDVTLYSAAAGEWIKQNPTTGYIGGTGSGGMTVTDWTAAVAGGTAGGGMWHFGNSGARLTRIKIVVGGTGGVVKATTHAKM